MTIIIFKRKGDFDTLFFYLLNISLLTNGRRCMHSLNKSSRRLIEEALRMSPKYPGLCIAGIHVGVAR